MRATAAFSITALVLVLASLLQAQGTAPATPLTLVTRDGRRAIPSTMLNGQEFIALDDLAPVFQLTVREDVASGGVTIAYKGRTIVASVGQPVASVNGQVVALPVPVSRIGRRLAVTVDFLVRALAPIYDAPIDVRRASRLLLVGAVRVARVTARVDAAGPPTRATVDITPASLVSVTTDAGRVLLKIDTDAVDLAAAAPGGLVDQFRTSDAPTTVTLVLNQRAGAPRVSTTTGQDATRVSIEVAALPAQDTALPPALPTPALPPSPLAPPSPAAPPPELLAPGAGAGTLRTIVIDPGHGGDDTGVRGVGGVVEKDVTLDVGRRLKTAIEGSLGVRVVMTRDDDRMLTPDDRDAVANNSKADLFVSLHANGAPSPAAQGAEVYMLGLDQGAEAARAAATAATLVLPLAGGGERAIDVVRWDLAQAAHVGASGRFAAMVEASLRSRIPMGARPLQTLPMRVLSGANMPAVLVEMAYLTNPEQAQQAQTAEYQTAVAQALYDAIVGFRALLEAPPAP